MSLSADQREAPFADRLFEALKPFDRYATLPGPDNRIVDLNLADPRVIEALLGVVKAVSEEIVMQRWEQRYREGWADACAALAQQVGVLEQAPSEAEPPARPQPKRPSPMQRIKR